MICFETIHYINLVAYIQNVDSFAYDDKFCHIGLIYQLQLNIIIIYTIGVHLYRQFMPMKEYLIKWFIYGWHLSIYLSSYKQCPLCIQMEVCKQYFMRGQFQEFQYYIIALLLLFIVFCCISFNPLNTDSKYNLDHKLYCIKIVNVRTSTYTLV